MLHYLLLGIPTGLFFGGLGGIFISGSLNCKRSTSNIIIITLVIIMTLFGGLYFAQEQQFNNGYCIKCGSRYELKAVDRAIEYYECTNPNCRYRVWR